MADASVYLMNNYDDEEFVNVGTGKDVTIRELAETIKVVIGYQGTLKFDSTKPDGTPRKLMDVSKLEKNGWKAKILLINGIHDTYSWFLAHQDDFKK
jgi:GDP-L-fucose synthase